MQERIGPTAQFGDVLSTLDGVTLLYGEVGYIGINGDQVAAVPDKYNWNAISAFCDACNGTSIGCFDGSSGGGLYVNALVFALCIFADD